MPRPRKSRNFPRRKRNYRRKAPTTKKALMSMRTPIIETKAVAQDNNDNDDSGTSELILQPVAPGSTDPLTSHSIICPVHYNLKQGLRDWEFSGDEITQKYLKQKLSFKFPAGEEVIRNPYRIQVIHGFITRPAGFTQFDDHLASQISREDLVNRLNKLIAKPWNEPEDYMDFRTKQKTFYKIVGKQWVKPNKTNNISMLPHPHWQSGAPEEISGSIPDVNLTITWPVYGRKLRLTYSDDYQGASEPFWYNNEAWFPFTVIYTPDATNIQGGIYATDAQKVKVFYNTKMWFSDS
eukprot:COSAG04_NODE_4025_length_2355_cov_180.578457_2_plen_294_part_00